VAVASTAPAIPPESSEIPGEMTCFDFFCWTGFSATVTVVCATVAMMTIVSRLQLSGYLRVQLQNAKPIRIKKEGEITEKKKK
jgi:hypothetical protein